MYIQTVISSDPILLLPGQILDYAGKQWSGLVAKYYIPRCYPSVHPFSGDIIENALLQMENVLQDFGTVSPHWKQI